LMQYLPEQKSQPCSFPLSLLGFSGTSNPTQQLNEFHRALLAVEIFADISTRGISHIMCLVLIFIKAENCGGKCFIVSGRYIDASVGLLNYLSYNPIDSQDCGSSSSHIVENFVWVGCTEHRNILKNCHANICRSQNLWHFVLGSRSSKNNICELHFFCCSLQIGSLFSIAEKDK